MNLSDNPGDLDRLADEYQQRYVDEATDDDDGEDFDSDEESRIRHATMRGESQSDFWLD
jgi:hypothetical protein